VSKDVREKLASLPSRYVGGGLECRPGADFVAKGGGNPMYWPPALTWPNGVAGLCASFRIWEGWEEAGSLEF
jgi:hypothetical protein